MRKEGQCSWDLAPYTLWLVVKKLSEVRLMLRAFSWTVLVLLLVFLIVTLVFASIGLWRDPRAPELFRDLLTIILAIAGIGIAAGGGLVYMIINASMRRSAEEFHREMRLNVEQFREEVRSAVNEERLRSMALSHMSSGYGWWRSYKETSEVAHREEAIRETEYAYSSYAIHLDEKEADNQLVICAIENNLAYYYAERQRPEDRDLAREYAEYIRKKIPAHPHEKVTWEDTYKFVLQQYP